MFPGQLGNFPDGLQSACLVVGQHNGDEGGIGFDGTPNLLWVHKAKSVHREHGHTDSQFFKEQERVYDSGMLHSRGDDMEISWISQIDDPFQNHVIGFTATRGEDNFVPLAAQEHGHLLPTLLKSFFGPCSQSIGT